MTGFKRSCKILAVALAAILIVGGIINGVAAFLSSRTGSVNNTLSVGDVKISIAETNERTLPLVPGTTVDKDPKITVKSGSADCYVYVKIRESANLKTYITYEVADGWAPLGEDYPGIYYRESSSMNVDAVYSVLKGDKVSVKNVDNTTLSLITGNNLPRLSFAGFAVQKRDVNDAVAGWIALKTRYPNLK